MATIQSVLEFQDKMSATIKKISDNLENATANATIAKTSLQQLENEQKQWKQTLDNANNSAVKNTENIKKAQEKYDETTKAVEKTKTEIKKYEKVIQDTQNKIDVFSNKQEELNKILDDTKNKFPKLNKNFSIWGISIGNIIGNYATRAIDGFKNAIAMGIQTASDLAEAQNVVDVTFDNSADIINKWSETTLDKFGLNELSAKQYAGTMGSLLKSSGITGDAMLEMSTKLTELSGDMASFKNMSNEEAFNKIRAGITGVTMPLKQIGIDMSEANLSAFAMSQGLGIAYNKMSESSKMILRYQYLLDATKDYQGDFYDTQKSFANQQKLLGENWGKLSAAIANLFIPALAKGMQVVNGLMKAGVGLVDIIKLLTPALISMAAVVITANIPSLIALGKQYTVLGAKAIWAGLMMAKGWLIGLGPIGWITAAVGVLVGALTILINKNKAVAETFWGIVSAIDAALTKFAQWRNRDNAEKVAELQAGLDKRIADRQARVENIGKKEEKQDKVGTGFEWKDLITSGGTGGKALKTKQQGEIEINGEDLQLLHDMATRDYMVNYQQQNLTPQVNLPNVVIHETADVDSVVESLVSAVTDLAQSKLVRA